MCTCGKPDNLITESPRLEKTYKITLFTSYMREEADPLLTAASLQVVTESSMVSPEPPLLQAEQFQLLQPLLIRPVLQTPHQLCCPSLDLLHGLSVLQ